MRDQIFRSINDSAATVAANQAFDKLKSILEWDESLVLKGDESNEKVVNALDNKIENLKNLMADYLKSDDFQKIIAFTNNARSVYAGDKISKIVVKYGEIPIAEELPDAKEIPDAEEIPDAGGITKDANKWIIAPHYDIRVLYMLNQNNNKDYFNKLRWAFIQKILKNIRHALIISWASHLLRINEKSPGWVNFVDIVHQVLGENLQSTKTHPLLSASSSDANLSELDPTTFPDSSNNAQDGAGSSFLYESPVPSGPPQLPPAPEREYSTAKFESNRRGGNLVFNFTPSP